MSRDELVGMTGQMLAVTSVPDGSGATGYAGIVGPPVPPNSLLALFSSFPMDTRSIDYMRRSGPATAAIAPHGSVKHESDLTYTPASVRAITVAAYLKVAKQDLGDVGTS